MIVQSSGRDGMASLSFTVPRADVATGRGRRSGRASAPPDAGPVTSDPAIAKLSVFGIGMRTHVGVAIADVQGSGRRRASTST